MFPTHNLITTNKQPVVHWGVRFVHEDVISVYGPGDEAKAAAEASVERWVQTPYPAELVSQTVLPWSATIDTKVSLVQAVQEASSDPRAVIFLRTWLVENGFDQEGSMKTGLKEQVPLVKQMRKVPDIARSLSLLNAWLREHEYEKLSSDEALELLREQLRG